MEPLIAHGHELLPPLHRRRHAAVEPLCAMLVDKEHYTPDARSYAADALGRIGDPRAVAPLVALLTDQDEDDDILTSSALEALKWLVLSQLPTPLGVGS